MEPPSSRRLRRATGLRSERSERRGKRLERQRNGGTPDPAAERSGATGERPEYSNLFSNYFLFAL